MTAQCLIGCDLPSSRARTCLMVLCGLPGAGKSALAKALALEAAHQFVDVRTIDFDEMGCQPSGGAGDGGGSGGVGGGAGEALAAFSPEAWQQARRRALEALEKELEPSGIQPSRGITKRPGITTGRQEQGAGAAAGAGAGDNTAKPAAAIAVAETGSSAVASQQHAVPAHQPPPQQPQQQQQQQRPEEKQQQQQQEGSLVDQPAKEHQHVLPHATAAEQAQQAQQGQQYRLVVVDDNMQYRSMRWQCYRLARAAGAAAVLLYLRCPEALAHQRNAERAPPHRVPADVIARMAAQMEEPGGSSSSGSREAAACCQEDSRDVGRSPGPPRVEGCSEAPGSSSGGGSSSGPGWESSCLVVWDSGQPLDSTAAAALWQQIWQRWGPPAPPPYDAAAAEAARSAAQAATAASLAHAVDLATRQVLSDCMQCLPATAGQRRKAEAARQLNAARRQLLQEAAAAVADAAVAAAQGYSCEEEAGAAAPSVAGHWARVFQQRCESILHGLELSEAAGS